MTYLQFHMVFTLPAVFILKWTGPRLVSSDATKAVLSLLTISVIAFVWTTPWDNYLVARGVWGYGDGRVLSTWGHVPVEEYFFFIIQPVITGLWLYRLIWGRRTDSKRAPSRKARIAGTILFSVLSLIGLSLLQYDSTLYLGLILVWSCPLLAFQWLYGGHHLWRLRRIWFLATAIPTVYLWAADLFAIKRGIWFISDRFTIGVDAFGLPVEEALFFLVTNLLVVQGLILMLHTLKVKALQIPRPRVLAGAPVSPTAVH